jgi:hypothetical protein
MKLHHLYKYFRRAWSREASHMLTLARKHPDPVVRLSAVLTLIAWRIPLDGSAPSMNFRGLSHKQWRNQ